MWRIYEIDLLSKNQNYIIENKIILLVIFLKLYSDEIKISKTPTFIFIKTKNIVKKIDRIIGEWWWRLYCKGIIRKKDELIL